jgi:glucokinase
VVAGRVEATNLGLKLDEKSLRKELNCPQLFLVNDLFATAASIPSLESSDFAILQIGDESKVNSDSPVAILAPGTGLGMAFLLGGEIHNILASEGGHVDFAPRNEDEVELWRYLKKRFGRVSCERLLSGPGMVNIFDWIRGRDVEKGPNHTEVTGFSAGKPDGAAIVSAAAAGDKVALAAVSFFMTILGSVAGDLVLTSMAAGGLCLAGGIPAKIIEFLHQEHFINAFTAKGRMSNWIRQVPVKVVLNPEAALLGAARIALERSVS